jgi:hypothetical protein
LLTTSKDDRNRVSDVKFTTFSQKYSHRPPSDV